MLFPKVNKIIVHISTV